MKFLIHGNTPTVLTGYGVQSRYLADRLTRDGHQVAFSSTYGQQYGVGTWVTPHGHQVKLYPNGIYTNSPDTIIAHAEHFFDGDPEAGWIIPLIDVWSLLGRAGDLADFQVAAWTPVDHFPVPDQVASFLSQSGAVPVAMSRYGETQLVNAGLDPTYIPLAVDTDIYKPTFDIEVAGQTVTSRQLYDIPHDAFVVGMVAMNKDPLDRKGFNEAFRAFGQFWQKHQNARLFVHTEKWGAAGGLNLPMLAAHCSVPTHTIIWADQYAYRIGLPANMMAAAYTAMDVLLAPSHGEGFCVPLIEAQACGTPVIVTDFSSQSELAGPTGWTVQAQAWWDQAQDASYVVPYIGEIIVRLDEAYEALEADADGIADDCVEFAAGYSADRVYDEYWRPFLASLEPAPLPDKPVMESVDVVVPLMRPDNLPRLLGSLEDFDHVNVIVVHDGLDIDPEYVIDAVDTGKAHTTYAEKINAALGASIADWVLVVGDDVEFEHGWFEAAQPLTAHYDIVGTNDSEEGRTRNTDVAAGRHADHFFVRRSYIDDEGGSLDGPGTLMPTVYTHWFVDREVIELAKARGVYGHAHDCRIIHHHPGYDGDEAAREADPVYMMAVDSSDADYETWLSRAPLVEGHRITRATP